MLIDCLNSHGTSWQKTAKTQLTGNEHVSLKMAEEIPLKFKDESFGAIKMSPKNFDGNFTGNEPKNDRK